MSGLQPAVTCTIRSKSHLATTIPGPTGPVSHQTLFPSPRPGFPPPSFGAHVLWPRAHTLRVLPLRQILHSGAQQEQERVDELGSLLQTPRPTADGQARSLVGPPRWAGRASRGRTSRAARLGEVVNCPGGGPGRPGSAAAEAWLGGRTDRFDCPEGPPTHPQKGTSELGCPRQAERQRDEDPRTPGSAWPQRGHVCVVLG